jgi:hypothetical protein
MSFIIFWNVAGELVKPKNITKGLYRSWLAKSRLIFIALFNPHIIVAPSNIQFGEVFDVL